LGVEDGVAVGVDDGVGVGVDVGVAPIIAATSVRTTGRLL
jgi:hypothetical protein